MISHARRVELFGEFSFAPSPLPGNPEHVTIDRSWRLANLVDVEVPQLRGLAGPKGRVTVHRLAKAPLLALFAAWEREGLVKHLHSFNGAFASRFKRQNGTEAERAARCATLGAGSLSNHSWGTAADFNARELPLGKPPPAGHPFQLYLAPVARGLGWEWGGDYRIRPDPMHFELSRI